MRTPKARKKQPALPRSGSKQRKQQEGGGNEALMKKSQTNKNVRMKAARALKGMSQEDLAREVGVTRQTIGMIEAGDYNPTLNLCIAICRALGQTLDGLFWNE